MKISDIVAEYIGLRDMKAELAKEVKEIDAKMLELEMKILEISRDTGVESFKTAEGTAYRVTKEYTSVRDRKLLEDYVKKSGDLGVFTNHLTKKHVIELMDEGLEPESIGIAYSSELAINIRKS